MVEHYLELFQNYVISHPYFGGLFAFLVAFAESLPLLGTIIPGSITMTFIGILVGRNILPFSSTLFLATIGALAGDMIGFWIGKHFNERLHTMWPFKKRPKWLAMGHAFFEKHGGKSIVIGRFIGPTRSSVPLFAGLLKMRWPNFIIAAIPSAFLWAIAYLVPGVIIGAISLSLPKGQATTFSLIGLAVIVLLWLVFWAIQRFFVYIASHINRWIDSLWNWLNRHHSSRFVIRLITNQQNPLDHNQLTIVLLAILSALLFIVTFTNVIFHVGIFDGNHPTFYFLQTLRNHHADKFAIVMTLLGDKITILAISVLVGIYCILRRQWYVFWHLFIVMLLAFGGVYIFKHVYFSPRPTGFLIVAPNSSFPSGHSTLSLCLFGFLSYLSSLLLEKKWRWIPYTLGSIIIILIMFSRLYLGAHWLCDILGATFLGFFILLMVVTSFRRRQPNAKHPITWLIAVSIAISIPWVVIATTEFHHSMYRYTPYYPSQYVKTERWWEDPTHYAPTFRLSRFGHPIQPFNIQWLGNISNIHTTLLKNGWHNASSKTNLKNALQRFASKAPESHLAFLRQLYHGKGPTLFMIKTFGPNKNLIELRLWKTGLIFSDDLTLYIGSINYHKPAPSLINLQPRNQISLAHGAGTIELLEGIAESYEAKNFKPKHLLLTNKIKRLNWNQYVTLIQPSS